MAGVSATNLVACTVAATVGGVAAAVLMPCAGVAGFYLAYRVIKEW